MRHLVHSDRFPIALLLLAAALVVACSSGAGNNSAGKSPTTTALASIAATSRSSSSPAPAGAAVVTATPGSGGGNVDVPAGVVRADAALSAAAGSGSAVDQVALSKPVTISFWDAAADTSAVGVKLAALIKDFETRYPNITVNAQYIGTYDQLFQKVQTGITGGQTPDLAVTYEEYTATYETASVVVPLDNYIKSKTYGLTPADYNDIFQAYRYDNLFAAYNNQMLSFPFTKSVELMYYNADQLKAAGVALPQTWDDFIKAAAATSVGGVKAYAIGIDASRFVTQMYTRGGALLSDDQKKAVFNNQQGVDSLSFYQQLIKSGSAYLIAKSKDDQSDFVAGKTTFNFSSSAGLTGYQQGIQASSTPINWGVALPPHATGAPPATDMYGPNVSMFKSTPERQLAAWLFIKYFTSKEVNPDWSVSTGYLPIRASGMDDPKVQAAIKAFPQYAVAVQAQPFGRPEPNVRQWDDIRSAIQDAMVAAIADPGKSPKALLDTAAGQANDALSR